MGAFERLNNNNKKLLKKMFKVPCLLRIAHGKDFVVANAKNLPGILGQV